MGVMKFWADMKKAAKVTSGDLGGSISATAKEILSHVTFKSCNASAGPVYLAFHCVLQFVALGIATAIGVLYIDILHIESPSA